MITYLMSVSGLNVKSPSQDELRSLAYAIEDRMKQLPQEEIPVEHEFADGLYSRKILIKKGVSLSGKVHKQDDLNIMVYGDITILTEHGFKRLNGHNIYRGKAGIKQLGFAHEDTLWITVHHTHLTDLDEIEAALFDESEEKIFDFKTGKIREDWIPNNERNKELLKRGELCLAL